jgi:hypothetical protein
VASIGGHGHFPLIPITCLEKPSGAAVTKSMLQLYVTVPAKAIDANERKKMKVITILATSGSDLFVMELLKIFHHLVGTCRLLKPTPETHFYGGFPRPSFSFLAACTIDFLH